MVVTVAVNGVTMKINASTLTLLSQDQQEESVFQTQADKSPSYWIRDYLYKKKGRYAPTVHIHLQDDVRYGDLGSFIQTGEDVKQTFALVPTEITTGTNLWSEECLPSTSKEPCCSTEEGQASPRSSHVEVARERTHKEARDVHSASPIRLCKGLWSYPGSLDYHQRLLGNKVATPS